MYTRVHFPEKLAKSNSAVTDLILNSFSQKNLSIQDLQSIGSSIQNPTDKQVFGLMSSYIFQAESLSPFSGDIFIKLLAKKEATSNCKIFNKDHLKAMSEQNMDDSSSMLFLDAMDMAGLKGKIIVKPGCDDRSYVELTNGHVFEGITPLFSVNEKELINPKIICLDGYVETVSEIHRLLETSSSSKEVVVIFLRGASTEVIHTLKVNYDRKTVVVIPVAVPFDLDGINLLNDIAVISLCDVVSSNKGQLISSLDVSGSKRIDSIGLYKDSVLLKNGDSQGRLDKYIHDLQIKLQGSHELSKEAYEKRIQRLGSLQVTITLPDNKTYLSRRFKFDRCIRSVKKSLEFGIVEFEGKIYPNSSYQAALMLKNKFHSSLNEIGCIVE